MLGEWFDWPYYVRGWFDSGPPLHQQALRGVPRQPMLKMLGTNSDGQMDYIPEVSRVVSLALTAFSVAVAL